MMPTLKCPVDGCQVTYDEDDYRSQADHMETHHPEVIARRRIEAARWDGWEGD